MLKNNIEDKIKGALYGFAIGDAIGATTEFMDEDAIQKKYGYLDGMVGGGWLHLIPGQVTDDTEMTICVIQALMDSNCNQMEFAKQCRKQFINWLSGGPKDVGGSCAKGIQWLNQSGSYQARYDPEALGNGALMRSVPCAILGNWTLQVSQAQMTHNNTKQLSYIWDYHAVLHELMVIGDAPYPHAKQGPVQPTGYIENTLINAMWAAKQYPNYESVVLALVNMGGDADTIGALGGALAGAKFGFQSIPEKWVEKLEDKVKNIFEKFSKYCCQILESRL